MGQISSDPRTYQWREEVRKWVLYTEDFYKQYEGKIEIIDPCENMFNQSLIKAHSSDEKSFHDLALLSMPLGILPPLDLGYVKRSTMGLVNLNHYSPDRQIIGSYFELAWYYGMFPDKPVIGIFDGLPEEHYHCSHPFIKASVHHWTKNVTEAMNTILKQCFH
jgi:hypothetical protein